MTDKFLRGKQPLTFWRGANGQAGGYLYRGGILEASQVDAKDTDRLVAEGFLEWVVRDGEQFRLAEDTTTGSKGDAVTVGDNGFPPQSETDHGTTNSGAQTAATESAAKVDDEVEQKRAAARQKLTEIGGEPDGRSSQAVWVEYLVGRGSRYEDVKDATKADLMKLAEQQKS